MRGSVAFPFLTLADDTVQAGPWQVALDDGEFRDAADYLPDWDIASSIRLRRSLRVDHTAASTQTGIKPSDLRLAVVATVGTAGGRLPRYVPTRQRLDIDPAGAETLIDLSVAGVALSKVVRLTTEVVLAKVPTDAGELAPHHLGDRLWRQHDNIRVEGEELRFPIEAVDFGGLLADATAEAAPWLVHWMPGEWTSDFHGAFRLFLNSANPEVQRAIEEENALVLQAMMADVMSQLCESLLRETDPAAEEIIKGCDSGTVGAQARSWLELAWPGRDLSYVRSVLDNTPSIFRAALLAAAHTSPAES